MQSDFDFSGFEDIISKNFYKDDFAHISQEQDDVDTLFSATIKDNLFDTDSTVEDDSLDFI